MLIYLPLLIQKLLAPNNPNPDKLATYECGEESEGSAWVQFNIRFYVVALIFLIFDVEVVFLFPWAVVFNDLGLLALVEMGIFLLILLVGLAYVWKRSDLDWVKYNVKYGRGRYSSLLENKFQDNVVVASLDKILGWARSTSPWYFQFGLACCAIEMMASAASRHDLERIGMMPRSSPRQADVMIVAGTVTMKMALRVKKLYEQMADPKYVISMGSCATSGGPYWQHGYHVLKGVDLVVPVDVYVPGCPPRPEALIEGLLKLQEKIQTERPLTRKLA